jgi:glutathione synthase/RimK-type ligase-like ATP-grasp enzyme
MTTAPLTVLIHTMHDDWHAILMDAALRERGHRVVRYFGSDYPARADLTMTFADGDEEARLVTIDGEVALDDIDVVWNRRMLAPELPAGIDPRDRSYVAQQIRFADAALRNRLSDAFWVNPHDAARNADSKPRQLQLAAGSGLRVPPTLVSNDPAAIRDFLTRHANVIHKPLVGGQWEEDGRTLATYTARVRLEDLPDDALLRAAPGIFQALVKKRFEVRAQFLGASYFALKIDSSRIEYGEMDWRLHQRGDMTDGSVLLPDSVYAACMRQLRSLGLVAGAFDFIVTPDDEWIYLEVNEAGQFIFVEQWCEELTIFDAFCDFIERRDADFSYVRKRDPQRLRALIAHVDPAAVAAADKRKRGIDTAHAQAQPA